MNENTSAISIADDVREHFTPEDIALLEAYYGALHPDQDGSYEYRS